MTIEVRGGRRVAFTSMLFAAMAAATFSAASLGILAPFVIDDLGITRAALGVVIAVINIAGALLSPIAGRVTDRVGGKAAIVALFLAAASTFVLFGIAPGYLVLLLGAIVGGFSQASANPSTNKLIVEDLPVGQRGVVTGIKQSGVQAGIFLGGLIVPSLAVTLGWRGAYLIVAALPAMLALASLWVVPAAATTPEERRVRTRGRLPPAIGWLAGYGFLMGLSGAVTFLVPLFAVEAVGLDPRAAGLAAAVIGLFAVAGRILWSRYAEDTGAFRRSLAMMAGLSVAAAVVFWLSSSVAAWLIWPAAVLIALGSSSWNSVGMLAVMAEVGALATGRASGIVLFGFLTGLGIATPLFGAIVDSTSSYDVMWLLSGAAAATAIVVVALWRRSVV